MKNKLKSFCLSAAIIFAVWNTFTPTLVLAGQGAGRMLYTVPNTTFIENPAGDSGVVTINDTSGSISTLQTLINNARSANPNSIIVIHLLGGAVYPVGNAGLVLGSQECLVGSGAMVQAVNSSVTVPLIQVTSGSTNVSVAGGLLDGNGANINGLLVLAANHVNVDQVTVRNCGLDGIQVNGNGDTAFDNELTVTRCDVSGSPGHAGISVWNTTQTVCVDNNCHNNAIGIWLANCAYGNIANNTCVSNTTGIDFNSGNDNDIANNTCNNNTTGMLLDGSSSMIVSDALGSNPTAGINSRGSGNIFIDDLFTAGNGTNFINGGSGDKIVAYQGPLNVPGQNYFYPPLINDQHTNATIVNGLGRTDLTISSTTIDSVQSQYNSALTANPNNVIVLHLNGTFAVGATPLTLSANTCVLLNGTIQINASTTASAAIAGNGSPTHVSISGGIIDGGNLTGNNGITFSSASMVQVDSMTLRNFGPDNPRVGGSDVVHFSGGSTPYIVTRCTINGGAARGIWLQLSGVKSLISDNEVTAVNEDGVDCDSSTSGAVVKFNYCHDLVRYGVFFEQSASHNLALGNICNNDGRDINVYNNYATYRSPTAYNSVICNNLMGSNGLRNGSTGTNTTVTSHNFFFDNTAINASISSELYGSQNYFAQNYLSGGSLSTAGVESFFNSPDFGVYLQLQGGGSGLLVLVQNASTANGAAIVIGPASDQGNDQWVLVPTDSGYYQIKNKNSGLDLVVQGASTSAGAPIVQWTFGSAKNDQWMPLSAGNGFYYLVNRLSGLYLDVPNTSAGTQLDQQPPGGGASEQFNLTLTAAAPVSQVPFSLLVSPNSQTIIAGSNTAFTVALSTNSSFSNSVTFAVSGVPANAGATFNPASLSTNGNTTLGITTATNTAVGIYPLTISGVGDGTTNTVTVNLVVVSATAALPGLLIWTDASGTDTNWATARNWTNATSGGYGPPGTNNSLLFTNFAAVTASALTSPGSGVVIPANVNSFVDTSFSVLGLTNLANTTSASPTYHNLAIANGATLMAGGLQVGNFTQISLPDSSVVNLTVSGAGATLVVTNGGVAVSENSTNSGANDATLDLSALDNFILNGTQIRVGIEGGSGFRHASGIVYLAKTNTLTLASAGYSDPAGSGSPSSGNPALYLGHNGSSFGSGSQIYLGINNSLFLDYATVGRGDTNALLAFNPAFLGLNPSVYLRGTNGPSSRVGVYAVGDGSAGAQANNSPSTNDFSGGTVDALVNYLSVGRGRSGNNSSVGGSGVLTFNQGTINANTLSIGFVYPSGSNSPAGGVVNVNGGTLTVNSNLFLAQLANVAGQTATASGTLNINGGLVQAPNIVGGGGTATINLNSGTLDLQFGNPTPGQITNVSTLNIGLSGGVALLENAAAIAAASPITIGAYATLAGNTFVTAPGLAVNGTISPGGNGIGAITSSGTVTLGAGGTFVLAVQNATGSPGTGWDYLQSAGKLGVQSSSTNPFTIRPVSFANNQPGNMTNFNNNTNYDWVIATGGGGITNFSANEFAVDTSLFGNDLAGGYFVVTTNGNSLILSFTNNHPPVAGTVSLYRTGSTLAIPISQLAAHWSDPDGDPVILSDLADSSTNGLNNLSTDGIYIYYTNANRVADAILYTVQDLRTNPPAVYRAGDTVRTATGEIVLLPPPVLGNVAVAGTNLMFSGQGGIPSNTLYVLTSTNIALPLSAWTAILTNAFDAGGGFNFTNPVNAVPPQQFYLLESQ